MTEAELIARLRMMPTYSGDPKGPHWLPNQAADRIEAMIAERDALFRRATLAEEWRDHDKTRAEAAEAKLEKAVEALEYYADQFCEGFCQDFPLAGYTDEKCELDCGGCKARAVLARVKGVM